MRRILITGGYGFIGSNIVRYLHNHYPEDELHILDKLTYAGHLDNLVDIEKTDKIKSWYGDICNRRHVSYVMRAMKEVDVVIHLAAESHVDRSNMDPEIFRKTNILGTHVILHEASRAKAKLVHIVSTDEVYGSLPKGKKELKFNEESPHKPTSPYAKSKSIAEKRARWYHERFGVPVTISNCSNNYGPNHDPEKFFPRSITNLIMGKQVYLMGDGSNVRDWIYVEDHCRAIAMIVDAALENPKIIGESFCVGGNAERTNLEATRATLKLFGKRSENRHIKWIPDRLNHDDRYAIDSSKIKKMLGWEPEVEFEDGLKKTVEWFIENKKWWEPLKKGRPNIDPEAQFARAKERR